MDFLLPRHNVTVIKLCLRSVNQRELVEYRIGWLSFWQEFLSNHLQLYSLLSVNGCDVMPEDKYGLLRHKPKAKQ